jgi:poly(3-hydroxybutyrate) depolymerase
VLAFQGGADAHIVFSGGEGHAVGLPWAMIPQLWALAWERRARGCGGSLGDRNATTFVAQEGTENETRCTAWPACNGSANVTACVSPHGGHTWPGGQYAAACCRPESYEPVCCELYKADVGYLVQGGASASELMLDFFAEHSLQPAAGGGSLSGGLRERKARPGADGAGAREMRGDL